MKTRIMWLAALLLVPGTMAYASPDGVHAGLSLNLPGFGFHVGSAGVGLNIGLPWVAAPAPYYGYQSEVIEEPLIDEPVVIQEPPEFIMPPELGFYVAVGIPYDLFFFNNVYYFCSGNIWYSSPYYNGPWTRRYYTDIPYVLGRYPFDRIRHHRDNYYWRYQRYGAWDGFRHFRPGRHGGHAVVGRDHDRGGHDYARPYSPGRGYGNGPAYVRPDRGGSVYGRGPAYDRPPAYNRPVHRSRDYGDSRAVTRPYYGGQAAGRPAYSRPARPDQWRNDRPASISPFSFAPRSGDRPAYNRPSGYGRHQGSGAAFARPDGSGRGSGNGASYYRTDSGRQYGTSGTVSPRQHYSPGREGMGKGFGRGPGGSGSFNRGWQGQGR